MKTFNILTVSSLTALLSTLPIAHADDTEIYGTNGVNDANKFANPNVMIIVDTSGSMQGSASYTVKTPYVNSTDYSGSFSRILPNPNYNNGWGYPESRLKQSNSNCTSELSTLDTTGTVTSKFREWDTGSSTWVALSSSNSNSRYIQCHDDGWEYTLYSPNYVNWFHTNNTVEQVSTRMAVVQNAIGSLVDNLEDVNVGLMRFNSNSEGGNVDVAIGDITNTKTDITGAVNGYNPGGGTPLTEVLYEAGRYYHGKTPAYGSSSGGAVSGGSYISPITAQCQKNNIILFTDGEPSGDQGANDNVEDYIDDLNPPAAAGIDSSCSDSSPDGTCLDEMAYYLANKDASTAYLNDQVIKTYTIGGFGLNSAVELLSKTATKGQGDFYAADNAEDLAVVLSDIFKDILATNTTFTAPAVSVNAFNASEHRDELFYALFRPDDKTNWAGNLKKYRLSSAGNVLDKDGNAAIDTDTGYFATGSTGFWNISNPIVPDGGVVDAGGFSGKLTLARNVLSDNGIGPLLSFDNASNAETLDMESALSTDVVKLKSWVNGIDVLDEDGDDNFTEARNSIGDPLHSEPLVATYGGTAAAPDSTIFFGTNQGFIHAVNANSGTEVFSYLPKELQSIQKDYYDNTLPAISRPYGMDGLITSWIKDANKNGVIYDSANQLETGEHLYIYAGMRRGGLNYYALNVTDRNSPKLLFKIEGGAGDFTKLGQTWGRMTIAKVMFNGVSRQVAFIPGGYDTNQDSNTVREDDSMGNVIYMVDASDGTLLWSASNSDANTIVPDMKNSIPASISAIDINGDQHIDYFFAADTGGRVLRFDINPSNTDATDFAYGGVIADLAENDEANNRRFYSKPSVALVKDNQNGNYLSIALGSGHRAAPTSNKAVQDRFYVLKDTNINSMPPSFFNPSSSNDTSFYDAYKLEEAGTSINSGDADSKLVYNATNLISGIEPTSSMKKLMIEGGGWYINLTTIGEKSFTQATTFSGAILFTTFSPSGTTLGCGADTGIARLYALDQQWASPVIDLNNDGVIDEKDGSETLAHSGIAPRPVVIYRPDGGKSIAIGTETIDDSRFEEKRSSDDCADNNSCEEEVFKCESNNCYVTPVYWRQNENY